MSTIVVLDDWDAMCSGVEELAGLGARHEVRVHTDRAGGREQLVARLEDADVVMLFRERTALDAELLASLPRLRLIAQTGTGTAHIDVGAARRAGVEIATTPGASARSVAELAVALTLAVYHRVAEADAAVRAGCWPSIVGRELGGKTLGVLGYGRIGRLVAPIATALGMRVVAWSRTPFSDARVERVETMDDLFEQADCVTLHLRLTPETAGVVDRKKLSRMRRGGVLVNTARGALVVEADLVEALSSGHLHGAGLDVFAEEPLRQDSPLRQLRNVTLTPHVGWTTREAQERFVRLSVANIEAFLHGSPGEGRSAVASSAPDRGVSLRRVEH